MGKGKLVLAIKPKIMSTIQTGGDDKLLKNKSLKSKSKSRLQEYLD